MTARLNLQIFINYTILFFKKILFNNNLHDIYKKDYSVVIFGYIRVSRDEQNFDLKTDVLEKAGYEKIHKEKVIGAAEF